jgi:hypothetical protein
MTKAASTSEKSVVILYQAHARHNPEHGHLHRSCLLVRDESGITSWISNGNGINMSRLQCAEFTDTICTIVVCQLFREVRIDVDNRLHNTVILVNILIVYIEAHVLGT